MCVYAINVSRLYLCMYVCVCINNMFAATEVHAEVDPKIVKPYARIGNIKSRCIIFSSIYVYCVLLRLSFIPTQRYACFFLSVTDRAQSTIAHLSSSVTQRSNTIVEIAEQIKW